MKKAVVGIEKIKEQINSLVGKDIVIKVNCGRNRFKKVNGVVKDCYPAVFTVKEMEMTHTFSYYDVVCGDVNFL